MNQSHFTKTARAALLAWINVLPVSTKAASLDDLEDGLLFGELLEMLATREAFTSSSLNRMPSSSSEKKENLEKVYRGLAQLLRHSETPQLAPSPSNFRPIIDNPGEDGMCEFICAFLAAACLGEMAETYIPEILKLDKGALAELMAILEPMRAKVANAPADAAQEEEANESAGTSRDPDLEKEELMLQKQREIEKLKRQNADLNTRLDKLLETHTILTAKLRDSETELETQKRANAGNLPDEVKDLKEQRHANIAMIDELQSQLAETEQTVAQLQRQNADLAATAERVKELDDQVRILEHQAREHQRQEHVLEKYKMKAQEITGWQNKVRELQLRNEELEQGMAGRMDQETAKTRQLQNTLDQFREGQARYEETLADQQTVRESLKRMINDLKLQNEHYEQQRRIDEAHIKDLEEKLQMGGVSSNSSSPTRATGGWSSLEQELETSGGDDSAKLRMEISRLKAENGVLRNNMTVQAEAERLRNELDVANRKNDHLQLQYTEEVEKSQVAQSQLNALVSELPEDKLVPIVETLMSKGNFKLLTSGWFRDDAFVGMRNRYMVTLEALNKSRDTIQKLEANLADTTRELQTTKTDLGAVGQDAIHALEVLKSSDELVSRSLKAELDATRATLQAKIMEEEQMRKQLMDALISKDELRNLLDKANASAANASGPVSTAEGEEAAQKSKKDDKEKVEKLKSKLKQTIEQLEKSEQERYDLQRKLKTVEGGGALAAQKAASDQVIKNLQRENAMITTAWYDLTSRLQSNHVILQRRHDSSKSWIGKQRQMVNATPRR